MRTIYRGFNTGLIKTTKILQSMSAVGANVVRWEMLPCLSAGDYTPAQYIAAVQSEIGIINLFTQMCANMNLSIILDLHTKPNGHNTGFDKLSYKSPEKEPWISTLYTTWRLIAEAFKDEPIVIGYDLMNEPNYSSTSTWISVCRALINIVRPYNTSKKIILSSGTGNGQISQFTKMRPVQYADWYQFHMYKPGELTGQGLPGQAPIKRKFKAGEAYNALRDVRKWQKAHGNPEIFLGEFGCVRWAPANGAYQYIREVVNAANSWGWHWTYLSWRDGTSTFADLEVPSLPIEPAPARTNTDRLALIKIALTGAQA